jgi:hypothetical protein
MEHTWAVHMAKISHAPFGDGGLAGSWGFTQGSFPEKA